MLLVSTFLLCHAHQEKEGVAGDISRESYNSYYGHLFTVPTQKICTNDDRQARLCARSNKLFSRFIARNTIKVHKHLVIDEMSFGKKDFPTFMKLLMGILSNIQKRKNHSLEKRFILNAEIDLKSCKTLYHKRIYSSAVYHIQQATEKTTKAWVLYLGVVSEDQLKKIGHKTPRAFLELLDNSPIGNAARSLVQISNTKILTDTTRVRNLVESKGVEVARMDYESIKMLLDVLDRMDKQITKISKPYKTILKTPSVDPEEFFHIPVVFTSLYVISGVTFPHYEFTRYPGLAVESSEYTENLGIVKALPELMTITKKCIDTVSEFISM